MMLTLAQALDQAHAHLQPLYARTLARTETIPLSVARGRVLAEPLMAPHDNPPQDVSAMDGYAVRSRDTQNPPTTLRLVAEIKAGGTQAKPMNEGEAARIYTGGVMPQGADAVLIQEEAQQKGEHITCPQPLISGAYVREKGSDYKKGQRLFETRVCLDDRHIALLASLNQSRVKVVKKPVIGVVSTGDELVPVGTTLAAGRMGRIVASTLPALLAFIDSLGGQSYDLGIVKDDVGALQRVLLKAQKHCDCVVTTGGVSVGAYDVVARLIAEAQARMIFNRVAVRPGKPTTLGFFGAMPFLGLPGNAVSSLVCARLFLRPILCRLMGLEDKTMWLSLPVDESLDSNGRRAHYMRGQLVQQGKAVRACS